jgi:F-box-like
MLSLLPREPPSSPRTVVRTDPFDEDKTGETTTSRSYDDQHSSYSRGEDHEEQQDAVDPRRPVNDLSSCSRERVEQDQECHTKDINVHDDDDDDDDDGYSSIVDDDEEREEASSATTTVSVSSIGSSVSSSTRRPLLGQVVEQQQGQALVVVVLPAIIRLPVAAAPSPTRSCLVNATSTNKKKRRKGRAAVRGLWPEDKVVVDCSQQSPPTTNKTTTTTSSNTTRQLSDRLLSTVFSFLPVQDLVRCETVSRRWHAVSGRSELWTTIDASDYVAELYDTFIAVASNSQQQDQQQPSAASVQQAAVWTTQQLTQTLQAHHDIRYLTIRNVHNRLSADYLHLPLWRLVELTIGQFDNLTDTHLRSLLFLATLRCQTTNTTGIRRTLPLARLRLEHCPQLSKDCLTAVRTVCPHAWCSFVENDEPAASILSSSSLDNLLFSSQSNSGVMLNNNNNNNKASSSSLASLFV